MDSIFAKFILLFASILSVISAPNYIKLETDDLNFDFKTGGNYPIYHFLNIQNTGPEKERFEIFSDQPWVSARREGTDFNFVELPAGAFINFVLEIHPERLPDGVNAAEVNLRVLDIDALASQEIVLDEVEVPVTLSKNLVSPAQSPSSTTTPIPSPAAPKTTKAPQVTPDELNPIIKQIKLLIDSLRLLLEKLL